MSLSHFKAAVFQLNKDLDDRIATLISKLEEVIKQLKYIGEGITDNMLITKSSAAF